VAVAELRRTRFSCEALGPWLISLLGKRPEERLGRSGICGIGVIPSGSMYLQMLAVVAIDLRALDYSGQSSGALNLTDEAPVEVWIAVESMYGVGLVGYGRCEVGSCGVVARHSCNVQMVVLDLIQP